MTDKAIMLSIQPRYAEKIFSGEKTVELRRVKPKELADGSLVLVYVSSPTKCLYGAFKVASILERPVSSLWKSVKGKAAVSKQEFDVYYKNATSGVAIFIDQVWCLTKPLNLMQLKKGSDKFHPPQCFRYVEKNSYIFNRLSSVLRN